MLAKDMKIKLLIRQRNCIQNCLLAETDDGNPVRLYFGQVFPENINYFSKEGYDAKLVHSDALLSITKGIPIYAFTINDDVTLSAAENKQAEEYKPADTPADNNGAEFNIENIINAIFSFPGF